MKKMRLNLLFLVMDFLTLLAYPIGTVSRVVGGGPGTMIQRQMETQACGERWEIGLTALVSFPNWSR
jgi:hypothetical protein